MDLINHSELHQCSAHELQRLLAQAVQAQSMPGHDAQVAEIQARNIRFAITHIRQGRVNQNIAVC